MKKRVAMAGFLGLLGACAPALNYSPARIEAPPVSVPPEPTEGESRQPTQAEGSEGEAVIQDTGRGCGNRSTTECTQEPGCVQNSDGTCRESANECELVVPLTANYEVDDGAANWGAHGRVTYRSGDPCAAVDASCGYDLGTRLCQPFQVVSGCPPTAGEAETQQVFCMHPNQGALHCRYSDNGGTSFSCEVPEMAVGGAQPPPGSNDQPSSWVGRRDYDERGCPNSSTAYAAPCSAPRTLQCIARLSLFSMH